MSTTKILRSALAIAVLAACGGLHAQDAQSAPSVDSIIESLKADAPAAGPGQTRALRPGAAAMATAPAPAPAKAKPASINSAIYVTVRSTLMEAFASSHSATGNVCIRTCIAIYSASPLCHVCPCSLKIVVKM